MSDKYFELRTFNDIINSPIDVTKAVSVTIDKLTNGRYINSLNKEIKNINITLTFEYNYADTVKKENPLLKNMFYFNDIKLKIEAITPAFCSFISKFYNVYIFDNDYYENDRFQLLLAKLNDVDYSFFSYDGRYAFYKNSFYVSDVVNSGIFPYSDDHKKSIDQLIDYCISDRGSHNRMLYKKFVFNLQCYVMSQVVKKTHFDNGINFYFSGINTTLIINGSGNKICVDNKIIYESGNLSKVITYIVDKYLVSDKLFNELKTLLETN